MADNDDMTASGQTSIESDVERRLKPGPDFDPVNLMTQIFDDADSFAGPAEDVLLSWLMRLSPTVDQQAAAQCVLDTIVGSLDVGASTESVKLLELLRQSANQTMSSTQNNGHRRGGRSERLRG